MIRPTRGEIIPRKNNNRTSHNPTLCSDIGYISKVGEEEGSAEERESSDIQKNKKQKKQEKMITIKHIS